MSLTIELAPFEMAIIDDDLVRNGAEPRKIVVSDGERVLREHEILTQEEADTPAKMLYLAVEHALLAKANHNEIHAHVHRIASEIAEVAPPLRDRISRLRFHLDQNALRCALAEARSIIAAEADILKQIYVDRPRDVTSKH